MEHTGDRIVEASMAGRRMHEYRVQGCKYGYTAKVRGDLHGVKLGLELALIVLLLALELGLNDELALEVLELRVEARNVVLQTGGDLVLGLDGRTEAERVSSIAGLGIVELVVEALLGLVHGRILLDLGLQLALDLLCNHRMSDDERNSEIPPLQYGQRGHAFMRPDTRIMEP